MKDKKLFSLGATGIALVYSVGCYLGTFYQPEIEQEDIHGIKQLEEFRQNLVFAGENFHAVLGVCEENINCLHEASRMYSSLRSEICIEVETSLRRNYKDILESDELEELVEGHRKQCEDGFGASLR